MKIEIPNNSERIFTEICNHRYLNGLVFHSPKIYNPTEFEIGDVLLWARTLLVNFELKWRNPNSESSNNSFIKKIGEKRDQLEKDYYIFKESKYEILLQNEEHKIVKYINENFKSENYVGVVLIDNPETINIKYYTLKKAFDLPFSICFLTFHGLLDILHEVDTIYDLALYLKDRFVFYKYLFKNYPETALELNAAHEKNLLGFYKINDNKFLEKDWNDTKKGQYWEIYNTEFKEKKAKRDEENSKSYVVDKIANHLFSLHEDESQLPLHAWELSTLTRRQRASVFADKIVDAFERLKNGNKKRYFSFYNQLTACWLLFYFRYGGNSEDFFKELTELCTLKTIFEINKKGFKYSVFGYGFRKSALSIGKDFDEVFLMVTDAENFENLSEYEIGKASKMFGVIKEYKIKEFPDT